MSEKKYDRYSHRLLHFASHIVTKLPTFHCNAKTPVLGPRVGLDPRRKISHWEYQHVGI